MRKTIRSSNFLFCHTSESGWINLVQMLRMMMPHMHEKGMKRFITHIMRISGKGTVVPQTGLKMT